MIDRYVIVDEAGDVGFTFDKEDVSTYFVVTAVIIEKENLETVEKEMEEIKMKYFQTRSMNLSELKEEKRKEIITVMAQSDFQIYSIVINKKKLYTDGAISYKKSLFQSIHRTLYRFLFKNDHDIQITADKMREKEYVVEFGKYIEERHTRNLFDSSEMIFDDGGSNIFLQLADIVCDTIFQKFEKGRPADEFLLKLLNNKIIQIEDWSTNDGKEPSEMISDLDRIIEEQSLELLNQFVVKHNFSDEPRMINQVNFLKFLKTSYLTGRNEYIKGEEIRRNINNISVEKVSLEGIRTNIVAPLRDAGLLVSSTVYGYKLPTTKEDLMDYVEFSSSTIPPMLSRLDKCRTRILEATSNELDVLEEEGSRELKQFFDGKLSRS